MCDVIIEVKTFEVINREALSDPTMRVGCLPCGDDDSDAASAVSEPLAAQIRYVVEDSFVRPRLFSRTFALPYA